jgi:hypothetical protein
VGDGVGDGRGVGEGVGRGVGDGVGRGVGDGVGRIPANMSVMGAALASFAVSVGSPRASSIVRSRE